jgi:hypothetical protein
MHTLLKYRQNCMPGNDGRAQHLIRAIAFSFVEPQGLRTIIE